jgi:hypothetical protein
MPVNYLADPYLLASKISHFSLLFTFGGRWPLPPATIMVTLKESGVDPFVY